VCVVWNNPAGGWVMSLTDEPSLILPPRDPATLSQAEVLAATSQEVRAKLLAGYSDSQLRALAYDWRFWCRPSQREPDGRWLTWFIRAGRGYGKTRVGSEFVRAKIDSGKYGRVALVGATAGDARDVMVEGESGLLSVFPPGKRPFYEPSKRRITFHNGAVGTTYSADEPERLRGPQHDCAWCDEPASWRFGKEAWDNLSLGLRLGDFPRACVTGTPKPTAWLRELSKRRSTINTVGSTYENLANLAPTFIEEVLSRYEGTTLGRQELHAEWLDDVEGALWLQRVIDTYRLTRWDRANTDKVVIGVDPPGETAECGIVVAGGPARHGPNAHAYVLDDLSIAGRPEAWGAQVVAGWRKWNADQVVVEANQGGDMVRAVIHAVDATCPVVKVRATVSKKERALPVSALYERGRVHHIGFLSMLESQMVTWVPDESPSPDRLDALVHAVTAIVPNEPHHAATVTSVAATRM
jgi:phage terminase large subunit-like protein